MDVSTNNSDRIEENILISVENVPNSVEIRSNNQNHSEMAHIPWYKYIPASLVVVLLIWKPLFVVLFPGFIYTSDLSKVFLFQGCIGG